MNHIDQTNWTLRFQLITVQLISFPLWLDTWWSLYQLRHVQESPAASPPPRRLLMIPCMPCTCSQVDGASVSQLYDMRSDKEERRVGGFAPEDDEATALKFTSDMEHGGTASVAAIVASNDFSLAGSRPSSGKLSSGGHVNTLNDRKSAPLKEVERKLAEVELDRTLCMNRIAQLEEELVRNTLPTCILLSYVLLLASFVLPLASAKCSAPLPTSA